MKNKLIVTAICLFQFLLSATVFAQQPAFDATRLGKIKITVVGFENNDGDLWFALDNSKEVYESDDSVFIGLILPIEDNKVVVEIDSLVYGEYAVKVYHDENQNNELDTNILGIPSEDYGFSHNVSGWFGPPRWERAMFILNRPELEIEIDID